MKKILCILLVLLLIGGMAGCMSKSNVKRLNRKESDSEYLLLVTEYMEQKYSMSFQVEEFIFPSEGFNTGLKQNIVVLKDNNGVKTNAKARLSTPYDFYDDYISSRAAAQIRTTIDNELFEMGNINILVTLKDEDLNDLDTSPNNISSLTVIGRISEKPDDIITKQLYEKYITICDKGYRNIYFLIGFSNNSSELDKAVANYTVYGKPKWSDYQGDFSGFLKVTKSGLTYEEFLSCLENTDVR